ncbi:MAG TPA: AzlD domain-containing protein [Peptococcaceae bacterium]|jgi:branched-subunit amino acid transport protein|nr:AzlD domain-containing protein [Clostridia bacterium]HOB82449.1 AzlD domain-containing protein [Peptococcaceae bacterium]HPZ70819.1 AzlD domain-containing protein [Peptococcaceae bacterium]HQD53521.1 AzlD domain-containing protein [Peptococcaceae bacterium]
MESKVLVLIIGMMLVTYLPRVLPLVVLSQVKIPPLVLSWLGYIPVAVLAALLAPELLLQENKLALSADNPALWAALPALLVAWRTKNLFYTVLVGMVAMVVFTHFLA